MTTYNGARLIGQSIDSILSQTFEDFELVIIDDASTVLLDPILALYDDSRIRWVRSERNLGVVGARNYGLGLCRGSYIACMDHDDLSRPHRFARQVDYLDHHPASVMVATLAQNFEQGSFSAPAEPDMIHPPVLRWLLHTGNPLTYSAIMVRADALRRLGGFMREQYLYCDDFDLYHRLLALGDIGCIDAPLAIYRVHSTNTSARVEQQMSTNAVAILSLAYKPWFGEQAADVARLLAPHAVARQAIKDAEGLRRAGAALTELLRSYLASHQLESADITRIEASAGRLWWRIVETSVRRGHPMLLRAYRRLPLARFYQPPASNIFRALLHGGLSPGGALHRARARLTRTLAALRWMDRSRAWPRNVAFVPADIETDRPPTLYVVIDTEWPNGLDRAVPLMNGSLQSVFARLGLRPIYAVDATSIGKSLAFETRPFPSGRSACEIAVTLQHSLHHDPVSIRAELTRLIDAVQVNLGIKPQFCRTSDQDGSPYTADLLAGHDLLVELRLPSDRLSDAPTALRFPSVPCWTAEGRLLTIPITTANIGFLRGPAAMLRALDSSPARRLRLRKWLPGLAMSGPVALVVEGKDTAAQTALIRALLARGQRIFILYCPRPSLVSDHDAMADRQAGAAARWEGIARICRFFIQECSGVAGDPCDLLRLARAHTFHAPGVGMGTARATSVLMGVRPPL